MTMTDLVVPRTLQARALIGLLANIIVKVSE
jgi:hypothetical protein